MIKPSYRLDKVVIEWDGQYNDFLYEISYYVDNDTFENQVQGKDQGILVFHKKSDLTSKEKKIYEVLRKQIKI